VKKTSNTYYKIIIQIVMIFVLHSKNAIFSTSLNADAPQLSKSIHLDFATICNIYL
jgi:hypothetical protein